MKASRTVTLSPKCLRRSSLATRARMLTSVDSSTEDAHVQICGGRNMRRNASGRGMLLVAAAVAATLVGQRCALADTVQTLITNPTGALRNNYTGVVGSVFAMGGN